MPKKKEDNKKPQITEREFLEELAQDIERKRVYEENVVSAGEAGKEAPEIIGVKSGVEGLDNLFFVTKIENGKVKVKPLGGYPFRSVMHLTGVADTGKSLMGEQFAIMQASLNYPICIITVEQPAAFLAGSLKLRAQAMGISWDEIEDKIIILDAASNSTLREDLPSLLNTLAFAIKKYGIKSTVIDSVTGLYEAREMMARTIVRILYNFMKKWHQTALFISQKRSGHEEMTAEAAGGYAVAHIVDGTIVLAKKEITSRYEQSIYGKPIGDLVRLFRIDGCRMAGHDTKTHIMEITESGLVKIGPSLAEYIQKVKSSK